MANNIKFLDRIFGFLKAPAKRKVVMGLLIIVIGGLGGLYGFSDIITIPVIKLAVQLKAFAIFGLSLVLYWLFSNNI